jgi:acetyl esterase/lipase
VRHAWRGATRRAAALAGVFSLTACSPARLASALTPKRGVSITREVAYGPLARQRLDLYAPPGLAPDAPLLLFVHGGAWVSGSRAEYGFVGLPLAQEGALVAVMDYRLWPDAAFPAFIEDTALAARWLAAREPARRLVLMGHSAGAFNAAAAALDPRWGARSAVGGFIGVSGPYDFTPEEVTPPDIFAGLARVEAVPEPVSLTEAPALLLLHGEADRTVGPYHSARLAARAGAAGVPVRHVTWPRLSHIDIMAGFAPASRFVRMGDAGVMAEVVGFLGRAGDRAA